MTRRLLTLAILAGCNATHVGNPEDAPVRPWGRCEDIYAGAERGCDGRPPATREIDDPGELADAVSRACPGDTIRAAGGRFPGQLRVGPGVTVVGAGSTETVVAADEGTVICAAGGATIEALTVESAGVGVSTTGAGTLTLRDVEVRPSRGFGVVLSALEKAALEGLTVRGPLTRDAATALTGPLRADRVVVAPLAVPSEDGARLFVFDVNGRHLRTLDAATENVLLIFEYDADGLLAGVADAFGRRTTIERAGDDTVRVVPPVEVAGPDAATVLTLDAVTRYLTAVELPTGERWTLGYGDEPELGLLQTFVEPRAGGA